MTLDTRADLHLAALERHGYNIQPVKNNSTTDGFFYNDWLGRHEYWYNTPDGSSHVVAVSAEVEAR